MAPDQHHPVQAEHSQRCRFRLRSTSNRVSAITADNAEAEDAAAPGEDHLASAGVIQKINDSLPTRRCWATAPDGVRKITRLDACGEQR